MDKVSASSDDICTSSVAIANAPSEHLFKFKGLTPTSQVNSLFPARLKPSLVPSVSIKKRKLDSSTTEIPSSVEMTKETTKKVTAKSQVKEKIAPTSKVARPQRTSTITSPDAAAISGTPISDHVESRDISPAPGSTVPSTQHIDIDSSQDTTYSDIATPDLATFDWARDMQQAQMAQAKQLADQQRQLSELFQLLQENKQLLQENQHLKTRVDQQQTSLDQTQAQLQEALAEIARLKSAKVPTSSSQAWDTASMNIDDEFPLPAPVNRGTDKSKYAHDYQPTGVSATKTPPKKMPALKSRPLTTKQRESIARMFQAPRPVSDSLEPTYQYIYMENRYRLRISEYRSKLRKLGIDNGRVLDIHYPSRSVVALLIHTGYATELQAILDKYRVVPLDSFDPVDPANVTDPELSKLPADQLKAKAVEIHETNLLRALRYVRPQVRSSLARDFVLHGWLSQEKVTQAVRGAGSSSSSPMANAQDENPFATTVNGEPEDLQMGDASATPQ